MMFGHHILYIYRRHLFTKVCILHWISFVTSQVSHLIRNRRLKNFIYVSSSLCSSLFFSTQCSAPHFKADLAAILWILNFVLLSHLFSKMSRYNVIWFTVCMWRVLWINFVVRYKISLLTYSKEQSPSWEANRFSASLEISRISLNRFI